MTTSLQHLAQVEVQLIFQYLDLKSLLITARCSISLYNDANSKVSFKYQPILNILKVNAESDTVLINNHPQLYFEESFFEFSKIPLELQKCIKNFKLENYNLVNCDGYNNNIVMTSIIEFIKDNSILTSLDLSNSIVTDDFAVNIFDVINTNHTLTELNLKYNRITDIGAVAIAEAIKDNKSNSALTSLHIGCNSIGEAGGMAIAEAIKHNCTLKLLDLNGNNIGYTGVMSLIKAIPNNHTLTSLDLRNNSISDTTCVAVRKVIGQYIRLCRIFI